MPHRFLIRRLKQFFIYRVLHVDDTPHRIALGIALAIFVTWTPTIGLQMVLAMALATLLNANKLVGVPFVWISNPLTLPVIFGPNFFLGNAILGGRYKVSEFRQAIEQAMTAHGSLWDRLIAWYEPFVPIFLPLWIGSLLVATFLGILTYVLIYVMVVLYRRRRHRRLEGGGGGTEGGPPGAEAGNDPESKQA